MAFPIAGSPCLMSHQMTSHHSTVRVGKDCPLIIMLMGRDDSLSEAGALDISLLQRMQWAYPCAKWPQADIDFGSALCVGCSEMGLWPCTSPQKQHLERLLGRIPPLAPPQKPAPPSQPAVQGPHAMTPGVRSQMLPQGPHRPPPRPPPPATPAQAHLPFNGPGPVQGKTHSSSHVHCNALLPVHIPASAHALSM